ncbi:cysteine desulfurase family protein [Deinococcus koreensis]|uniref:cysteine desulfurase n=1 Tax=Deinococcus koreensis TaxID=2054903 RepID=A0A2K3UWD4_9DEIO|nr:cysteine desulfurase family protein [Deinococcus koreensis]PNY80831.1 IscS subfamily cysteine desulfurase [Deinococcus koreensis]
MIYLDYNATTPCDPRVVEEMLPYFTNQFANPSSATHMAGRQAADAVELARGRVAQLVASDPRDVIFTSGATESNNLALYGVARAAQRNGDRRRRIITSAIEHKAVLDPCQDLAQEGFDIQYVPVDSEGFIDLERLQSLLTSDTLLVSIQAANSEIGTIQPIADISEVSGKAGAFFHCDATQAVGRVDIDWQNLPIDLISFSSHKLYGPKGAGALIAQRAVRQRHLSPLLRGGGQESKLRAGTQNVPAIVGFGAACNILKSEAWQETEEASKLRDYFEDMLLKNVSDVIFNGKLNKRLPNTSSVMIKGIEADALIANLPNFALSLGSACNSGAIEPSYVLLSLGLSRSSAESTFRVSMGRWTTKDQISEFVLAIADASRRLLSLQ